MEPPTCDGLTALATTMSLSSSNLIRSAKSTRFKMVIGSTVLLPGSVIVLNSNVISARVARWLAKSLVYVTGAYGGVNAGGPTTTSWIVLSTTFIVARWYLEEMIGVKYWKISLTSPKMVVSMPAKPVMVSCLVAPSKETIFSQVVFSITSLFKFWISVNEMSP
jgi:hypothetical protein